MKKQATPQRTVQFLFGLNKISPWLMWSAVVIQFVAITVSNTIAPIFVSRLLTSIANGTATVSASVGLLIGYGIVLFLGETILYRIVLALLYISESKMISKVDLRVLQHLTAKSIGFHSNQMSGGIVSDANKLLNAIEGFWDTIIFNVVPILGTVISVSIALSFIFWQYALALTLLSVVVIILMIMIQSRIAPIRKEVATKSSAKTAYLADVVSNISAVKAFAREKYELHRYNEHIKSWRSSLMKEMKSVMLITASFSTMMTILNVAAFTAAIFATQYHIANIGVIYLVVAYTLNVTSQLWQVSGSTRTYIRVVGDAGPMIDTLDSEIELKDPIDPEKSMISKGKIEFRNITFTHEQSHQPLFKNFSLTINPGEKIGLVGQSGSGKTSLARLLLRFSDVNRGDILIDGQDICDITQADLHEAIAYVPQEPVLFHRTLRENVAYSKPDASMKEIEKAATQANAMDFISGLKHKFETIVGERGIKLSGGQRQRVAIARAILKDAPILVLDEATSALDSENERLIQDALAKLMTKRTSIVIAHRLSTISKMDRIVVLDRGQIIEQGTHDELLKHGGIYARLWSQQSGGFIK